MKKAYYLIAAGLVAATTWGVLQLTTETPASAQAPQAQDKAMPIKTAVLELRSVRPWHSFSGTLVAVDRVDIRPRVSGMIEKVYFEPGAFVEEGTELFLIDPRPYQAEVNRQSAAVASARAQASLAKSESDRAKRLIKENAIAQRDFDSRQNASKVAYAQVQSVEAALQQAKLNLGYATIKAPITGKISRAEITEGNLVESGAQAPVLASLVSMDPIYADFDVDEQTYLANVRIPDDSNTTDQAIPVELVVNNDGAGHTYTGRIVSFDNKLDSSAGTIRARAIFENPGNRLVPGMFAEVHLGTADTVDAILIPDRVVNTDQDKKFVYVVDEDGTVTYRPVKLGGTVKGMRMVESGLQSGDRIIVNGLMRVRPGVKVEPQDVPLFEETSAETTDEHANETSDSEATDDVPAGAEMMEEERETIMLSPVDGPASEDTTSEETAE